MKKYIPSSSIARLLVSYQHVSHANNNIQRNYFYRHKLLKFSFNQARLFQSCTILAKSKQSYDLCNGLSLSLSQKSTDISEDDDICMGLIGHKEVDLVAMLPEVKNGELHIGNAGLFV